MSDITNSPGSPVGDIVYPQYDKLGNRREEDSLVVPNHPLHYNYTYNERYELTSVEDAFQATPFSYGYDAVGNRLNSTEHAQTSTYTTNSLNQYTSVNGTTYQYDLKGNLTSDGTQTYAYDYKSEALLPVPHDNNIFRLVLFSKSSFFDLAQRFDGAT